MKGENDFNAKLAKEFRVIRNDFRLGVKKLSERFEAGASDFLLVYDGRCAFLEVKFVKSLPAREDTVVLKHPFTGAQLKFFDDLALGGALCFGLIAIGDERRMLLIPRQQMGSGNLTKRELRAIVDERPCYYLDWNNVRGLLGRMFGGVCEP